MVDYIGPRTPLGGPILGICVSRCQGAGDHVAQACPGPSLSRHFVIMAQLQPYSPMQVLAPSSHR